MDNSRILPQEALRLLKEGNARYVCGRTEAPNRTRRRRVQTSQEGQNPFAVIVSCSDSRVPVPLLFDRGIGDIFSVNVAGNICGSLEIGSVELAVDHLNVALLLVLGHSGCGMVAAAVNEVPIHGNVVRLKEKILPSVEKARKDHPDLEGIELEDQVVKENVFFQMETLLTKSPVIRSAVRSGEADLMGAVYNIEHGDVAWMGRHPHEKALVR